MEYSYYLLRGNGLDEAAVMGAINRAKRRFYLRPGYLVRHAGDIARLAVTKWGVALAGGVAHPVRHAGGRRRAGRRPRRQPI